MMYYVHIAALIVIIVASGFTVYFSIQAERDSKRAAKAAREAADLLGEAPAAPGVSR